MRDTIDLVPIGGYYGKGLRTGLFGSYLMAAYNTNSRRFETVCKLGTGFSKEQLQSLHHRVKPLDEQSADRVASEIYSCHNSMKPDAWLSPTDVWEVQADSFTLSKSHTAGKAAIKQRDPAYTGLSLRFPRFIRIRDDKAVRIGVTDYIDAAKSGESEVGTSVEEILHIYMGTGNDGNS